jgi:ATP-dependent exoDNAse (exonuclease V) beta subunit
VGRHPSRHVDTEKRLWAEPLCGCSPLDLQDAREEELRRDREEAVRLAYVAATRARDLLVVPVLGDGAASEGEKWLDALNPVVYPERGERRRPRRATACPDFGDDSVYERPANVATGAGASVAPGLHRPKAGSHEVVWWDPKALELDVQEAVGLRQQRILEADRQGHAEASEQEHAAWQSAREAALARGATPTLVVETVTALAAAASASPGADGGARRVLGDVAVERVELDRSGRPGGKRFGTLVHAVLAAVDLTAGDDGVRACAEMQGRLLGAVEAEVAAAGSAVRAALAHPLLRRAAAAAARGELRRETPVLLKLPEGTLAEGVVDLAFREEEGGIRAWTVVDFKTDRELAGRRSEYEAQLRLYAEAIREATGEPARGVLLAV